MPRYSKEFIDATKDVVRGYEKVVRQLEKDDGPELVEAIAGFSRILNAEMQDYPGLLEVSHIDKDGIPHYYVAQ